MAIKLPDIITEKELMEILKVTKKPYHRMAFVLGFYECMRISEIINIQKEDVKRDLKLLYLRQAKGHKDRHIPIAPEVQKYLKYLPIPCGIRALQYAWHKSTEKALGYKLKFHILRHSGITYYLTKKKWNSLQVQRLAGHSKIQTTQLYTHINPTDLVEQMWSQENEI